MNYTVRLTHFGTSKDFASFNDALAWARAQCFEASIYCGSELFATFCPINGVRTFFN